MAVNRPRRAADKHAGKFIHSTEVLLGRKINTNLMRGCKADSAAALRTWNSGESGGGEGFKERKRRPVETKGAGGNIYLPVYVSIHLYWDMASRSFVKLFFSPRADDALSKLLKSAEMEDKREVFQTPTKFNHVRRTSFCETIFAKMMPCVCQTKW